MSSLPALRARVEELRGELLSAPPNPKRLKEELRPAIQDCFAALLEEMGICTDCDGDGWMPARSGVVTCNACGGHGFRPRKPQTLEEVFLEEERLKGAAPVSLNAGLERLQDPFVHEQFREIYTDRFAEPDTAGGDCDCPTCPRRSL